MRETFPRALSPSRRPEQIAAGHVPGLAQQALRTHALTFAAHGQQVQINVPALSPEQLADVANTVRKAAQETIACMPVMDVLAAIDRTIAHMLDCNNPERPAIERQLSIISGYDPEMVRLGISSCLKTFRRPQLLRFLAEDFADPGVLDDFRPGPSGGWRRAFGPGLLAHIWAGNVPGLPLWSLVAGLLVKAGNIGKVSSQEPLFASWFARTLASIEPRLGDCLAIVWWPGGEQALEQVLCRHADVFKVYGGDAAIAAWQRQLPAGKRLLAHGNRLSIGLVSASALDTRQARLVARELAADIVRWDQQGCYSPQVVYVERGAQVSPRDFAAELAGELTGFQHSFARRALSTDESATLAQWQHGLELSQLRGADTILLGQATDEWRIACLEQAQAPSPGALNRSISVIAVDDLEAFLDTYATKQAGHLQTAGLAASPEELFHLAPILARCGFTRICALGSMSTPVPGWHHDGRFSLLDLVRMVDIESSAVQAGEAFAGYRD